MAAARWVWKQKSGSPSQKSEQQSKCLRSYRCRLVSMPPDPEGSAHGCALFFDQGRDTLSKNPRNNETIGLPCRGKRFLWFVSLTLIKEMNSPKAKRFSTAKLVKPLLLRNHRFPAYPERRS